MIRFNATTGIDAYCATLDAIPDNILSDLQSRGLAHSFRRERGLNGFDFSIVTEQTPGEEVARILYGGRNPKPHIQSFGGSAQDVAECIRNAYPEHLVTRIDIARDFVQDGFFDLVQAMIVLLGTSSKIATPCAGEWFQEQKSRTQYMGSPSSIIRVRLYEKGAQLKHEMRNEPKSAALIPQDWVRLEAQIRPPSGLARHICASVAPSDLWGASPALRSLIEQIDGKLPSKFSLPRIKKSSPARGAFFNMQRQYGNQLRALDREIGRTAIMDLFQELLDT